MAYSADDYINRFYRRNPNIKPSKVDQKTLDWLNTELQKVQQQNNDSDSLWTASKQGLIANAGSALQTVSDMLIDMGKPQNVTMEDWKADLVKNSPFGWNPVVAASEYGEQIARENARNYTPMSPNSIAYGLAGVAPYAVALGATGVAAARTGNFKALGDMARVGTGQAITKASGIPVFGATIARHSPALTKAAGIVAPSATAGMLQTVPEAMFERQSTMDEYIADAKKKKTYVKGQTEAEARELANRVAMDNVGLLTGTNTLEQMLFANSPVGKARRIFKQAGIGAGLNAAEEGAQTIFPMAEAGEKWSLTDPRVLEAMLVGGAFGGMSQGAGEAAGVYFDSKTAQSEPATTESKPKEKPVLKANTTSGNADIDRIIEEKSKQYGIDPNLVHAVIQQESGYRTGVKSSAGAVGLMQLMPGTAGDLGVTDRTDPEQNIDGGIRYLKQMYEMNGGDWNNQNRETWEKALASYNGGYGNRNITQTRLYAHDVLKKYKDISGKDRIDSAVDTEVETEDMPYIDEEEVKNNAIDFAKYKLDKDGEDYSFLNSAIHRNDADAIIEKYSPEEIQDWADTQTIGDAKLRERYEASRDDNIKEILQNGQIKITDRQMLPFYRQSEPFRGGSIKKVKDGYVYTPPKDFLSRADVGQVAEANGITEMPQASQQAPQQSQQTKRDEMWGTKNDTLEQQLSKAHKRDEQKQLDEWAKEYEAEEAAVNQWVAEEEAREQEQKVLRQAEEVERQSLAQRLANALGGLSAEKGRGEVQRLLQVLNSPEVTENASANSEELARQMAEGRSKADQERRKNAFRQAQENKKTAQAMAKQKEREGLTQRLTDAVAGILENERTSLLNDMAEGRERAEHQRLVSMIIDDINKRVEEAQQRKEDDKAKNQVTSRTEVGQDNSTEKQNKYTEPQQAQEEVEEDENVKKETSDDVVGASEVTEEKAEVLDAVAEDGGFLDRLNEEERALVSDLKEKFGADWLSGMREVQEGITKERNDLIEKYARKMLDRVITLKKDAWAKEYVAWQFRLVNEGKTKEERRETLLKGLRHEAKHQLKKRPVDAVLGQPLIGAESCTKFAEMEAVLNGYANIQTQANKYNELQSKGEKSVDIAEADIQGETENAKTQQRTSERSKEKVGGDNPSGRTSGQKTPNPQVKYTFVIDAEGKDITELRNALPKQGMVKGSVYPDSAKKIIEVKYYDSLQKPDYKRIVKLGFKPKDEKSAFDEASAKQFPLIDTHNERLEDFFKTARDWCKSKGAGTLKDIVGDSEAKYFATERDKNKSPNQFMKFYEMAVAKGYTMPKKWQKLYEDCKVGREERKPVTAFVDKPKRNLDGLSTEEKTAVKELSPSGYKVYEATRKQFESGNADVKETGKMNAILFARYADRMADNIAKITGKPYTAEDYMRERMHIVADATEVDEIALNQLGEVDPAELEAQKEAVREKYQDTAEWMKAPNGEDTNLTEDQWLTVRTKAFKRWFGNWNYNENEVLEVVDITDTEMLNDDGMPVDIRDTKALSKWVRKNLQGSNIVVDSDGSVVNFYRRGIEDGVSKARDRGEGRDKNNRKLYSKLADVIKKSVYFDFDIADKKHQNRSYGVERYCSFLKAGDQFYRVEISLNTHIDLKTSYKGHQAYKIEIEPAVYRTQTEKSVAYARAGSISTISIGELMQGVKPKESSKVLDENDEPLVVYHGSDAEFDVFDREKTRANMDIQGNFFSPWEDDAQGYGENVRAFWLNIKNPASFSVGYKALNKFKGQNGAGIKAREYLISQGYDGVNNDNEEYVAFYPEQIKSTDNIGTFDAENPNVYKQSVRGQTKISGMSRVVSLFEQADKSTFVHELGHVALADLKMLAEMEGAPAQLVRDWQTVKEWLGYKDSQGFTREQHEKFARGFEAYLRSGEAPVRGLKAVFRRFKERLSEIYADFIQLGGKPSAEVRAVMDRMLASEQEIEAESGNNVRFKIKHQKNDVEIKRTFDEIKAEVKKAFPNATSMKYEGNDILVSLPNGAKVIVKVKDKIIVNDKAKDSARQAHGVKDNQDVGIQGYWQKVSGQDIDGILAVSKDSEEGTTYHESLHMAMDLALTPKEKKALTDYYAKVAEANGMDIEETIANGYAKWRRNRENAKFKGVFKKLHDFWHRLKAVFTGIENAHNVMRKIESGEVWERNTDEALRTKTEGDATFGKIANEKLTRDETAFANSVDAMQKGTLDQTKLVKVMHTPLVLQLIGAKDLPIKIKYSDLSKISLDKHNDSKSVENVKKLPRKMADPIAIFRSATRDDSYVLMLEMQSEAGSTYIASVAIDKIENDGGFEINLLTSAYGRGEKKPNDKWFASQVKTDNLLYVNTKKAHAWSLSKGVQFPEKKLHNGAFLASSIKTEADLVKLRNQHPTKYSVSTNKTAPSDPPSWLKRKWTGTKKKYYHEERVKQAIRKLTGLKVAWGKTDKDVIYDAEQGVIRTRVAQDWGNVVPKVAESIAAKLNVGVGKANGKRTIDPAMRDYITDYILTGALTKGNTKEAKDFETAMKKNPRYAEDVILLQSEFARYNGLSQAEKAMEGIEMDAESPRSFAEEVSQIITKVVDQYFPIYKMSMKLYSKMKEKGEKLPSWLNPNIIVRNVSGAQQQASLLIQLPQKRFSENATEDKQFIKEHIEAVKDMIRREFPTVDAWLVDRFKPLELILQEAGVYGEEDMARKFSTYMVARRMRELHEKGDRTTEDFPTEYDTKDKCDAIIAELENPAFEQAAQDMYDLQRIGLMIQYDAGLVSRAYIDRVTRENLNYIPLQRVMDDTLWSDDGNSHKKQEGSARRVWAPLDHAMENIAEGFVKAQRNKAMAQLAQAARLLGQAQTIEVVENNKPQSRNVVSYLVNGERVYIEAHPELACALARVKEPAGASFYVPLITMANRTSRELLTTHNPEFALTAFFRDAMNFFLYEGGHPIDWLKGIKHTVLRDAVFQEYMTSGASQSVLTAMDKDYFGRNVTGTSKDTFSGLKNTVKTLGKASSFLTDIAEQSIRVAAYEKIKDRTLREELDNLKADLKKQGKTDSEIKQAIQQYGMKDALLTAYTEARLGARDLMDFGTRGEWGAKLNGYAWFANAIIQGGYKSIRALNWKDPANKGKVQSRLLKLASICVLQALVSAAGEDDEEIKGLSDEDRYMYFHVKLGDRVWRLPKGDDLGIRTLTYWIDMAFNKRKVTLPRVVLPLENALPSLIMPSIVKPAVEVWMNHSLFYNSEIVPKRLQNPALPEREHDAFTSRVAKGLGETFGWSPKKLDYMMNGYFGGLGRAARGAVDWAVDGKAPKEMVGVRRFLVPMGKASVLVNDAYEYITEQDALYKDWQDRRKHDSSAKPDERFDRAKYSRLKTEKEKLQELTKKIRENRENPRITEAQREANHLAFTKARNKLAESIVFR